MEDTIDLNENKMLTEEKPETFTSPELKQEDGTIKKKKHTSRKPKKINANVTQPIRNPNPQVCSEPLEALPITELKPIEESTLPCSNETVRIQNLCSEPLEASPITELKPIEESMLPDSNMTVTIKNPNPQVCSEPLEASPITQLKPNEESTLPDSNKTPMKKKKRRTKKNVLNSQQPQPQPLSQSQPVPEPEPESKGHGKAELNDRKTNEEQKGEESNETKPSLDIALSTTEIEKKQEAEPIQVYAEGATTPTGKKKKQKKRKKKDEAAVENQTNVLHLENAVNHDQIQMNTTDTEHKEERHRSVLDGEQFNEHHVKPLDTAVQRPMELVTEPSIHPIESECHIEAPPTDPIILIDPHPATPIEAEQKIVKKSKIEGNAELNDKKKNEEKQGEESNETKPSSDIAVSTIEIEKKQEAEPIQVSAEGATTPTGKKKKRRKSKRKKRDEAAVAVENQTNLLHLENAVNHDQDQMNTTDTEHKEKRHRSVLDGEQFNEHNVKPLDTAVQRPMELVTEPSIHPIESECHIEAPPTDPTILIDPHPATPIDAEQKIVKKSRKRKRKGGLKSDGEAKPNEHNGEPHETLVQKLMGPVTAPSTIQMDPNRETGFQRPMEPVTEPSTDPINPECHIEEPSTDAIILTDPHPATPIVAEQNIVKKSRKRKRKGGPKSDGEAKPNEHSVELQETLVQKPIGSVTALSTIPTHHHPETDVQRPMKPVTGPSTDPINLECHIEAPSTDPIILMDPHPATLIVAEQNIVKKSRKRKRKGGLKSDGEGKPNEHIGEPRESLVQKPMGPVTAPSTIPTDPHTSSPIDSEQKKPKKRKKSKKRKGDLKSGDGLPNEVNGLNGKQPEISVQNSIDPIIPAPSVAPTVPIDPAIPKDPHPATLVKPKQKTSTTESKKKSEKKVKERKKTPMKKPRWKRELEERNAAKELVEVDKLQYHPLYHLGPNFTTCWACRQPDHTIKECKELRRVAKNAEICFFCGEIGHSLRKCSVSLAGGGRLARCLFCHAHGHFSYKCPGNSPVPTSEGVVAGGS
ncbi:uncharacterized protein [Cicer arietinum]|uniref:Titin-like n=1 Tax=Cicer arietinum TaxID=3827 RepID=A0A1S2XYK7_CICAR|nr:titin-like [Cicer arietinum]